MLAQYGRRVLGLDGSPRDVALAAIERTEGFFRGLGVGTRLADYGLTPADCSEVSERLARAGAKLGEHGDLTATDAGAILALAGVAVPG